MTSRRHPGGARRHGIEQSARGRGSLLAVAAVGAALSGAAPAAGQASSGLSAEAVAQTGLTRFRQGRMSEAAEALAAAMSADPTGARRWAAPYASAAFATDLSRARNALAAGDIDGAEAALLRAVRRDAPERAEAEVVLGDLALRRGDAQGAEPRYRAALAARPGLTAATIGLNASLRAQGRFAEADALSAGAGPAGPKAPADALRAEALATQDQEAALGLLRAALALAPADPGFRLDVARALARLGRSAEGRALLEEAGSGPVAGEAIYVAALFAREEGRFAEGMRLLSRVPDRLRDANAVRLMALLRLDADVTAAAESAGRGAEDARQGLLAVAMRPDPSGAAPVAAIRALLAAGNRDLAAAAARAAARVPRAPVGQLALAGVLADAGLRAEAESVLSTLAGAERLTPSEARQVALLRASPVAPVSRAAEAGPALPRAEPAGFAAGETRSPREVLGIAEAVLRRDPRNAAARYAAIEAALSLDDLPRAEALLQAGQAVAPNDPRIAMLDARVARRAGDPRRAQAALTVASEQRRSQIGADRTAVATASTGAPRQPEASRRVPLAGDGQGSSFTTVGANPGSVVSGAPTATEAQINDPLLNEIGRQLAEVNEEAASRLTLNGTIRGRSGTRGSERLMEYGGGAEGSVPVPGVGGTLTARVQGVHLDTGRANLTDDFNIRRYGTNAVGNGSTIAPFTSEIQGSAREAYRPRDTTASGVALGVAYQRDWLTVDVGSTPLGFREQNVLGGVEVTPSLGEGWRLRIRGERRAVTDSLLSWAGARDPVSGQTWGGVTRTGAYGQVEYGSQTFGAYAGGGYSIFRGRNVEDNSRYEFAAGVSQAIFRQPTQELVTGLDLLYLSYDKNLRLFSFGHGGYFSPQQYFAAAVPLDYRARFGNVALRLGISGGVSYFREDRSPYYPTNRSLQLQAEGQTAADSTVQSFYQSQQRTSFTGGVRADIEYAVTPSIRVGALARFDKVADFNEGRGMIYARFRLD